MLIRSVFFNIHVILDFPVIFLLISALIPSQPQSRSTLLHTFCSPCLFIISRFSLGIVISHLRSLALVKVFSCMDGFSSRCFCQGTSARQSYFANLICPETFYLERQRMRLFFTLPKMLYFKIQHIELG